MHTHSVVPVWCTICMDQQGIFALQLSCWSSTILLFPILYGRSSKDKGLGDAWAFPSLCPCDLSFGFIHVTLTRGSQRIKAKTIISLTASPRRKIMSFLSFLIHLKKKRKEKSKCRPDSWIRETDPVFQENWEQISDITEDLDKEKHSWAAAIAQDSSTCLELIRIQVWHQVLQKEKERYESSWLSLCHQPRKSNK